MSIFYTNDKQFIIKGCRIEVLNPKEPHNNRKEIKTLLKKYKNSHGIIIENYLFCDFYTFRDVCRVFKLWLKRKLKRKPKIRTIQEPPKTGKLKVKDVKRAVEMVKAEGLMRSK